MPIAGVNQAVINLPAANPKVEQTDGGRRESDKRNPQRDTVSISALGSGLTDLDSSQSGTAIDALAARTTQMTSQLADDIQAALASDGLSLETKLTFRLINDTLKLLEDLPHQDALERSLQKRPELATGFNELAEQSVLLQGLKSSSGARGRKGLNAYTQAAGTQANTPQQFRLSIVDGRGVSYFAEPEV